MIPSFVTSAHAEWTLPPTKYRLSKTFAGSAYQEERGGALLGSDTYGAGMSLKSSLLLGGRKHVRASVPRNSNSAAFFAVNCAASTSFEIVGSGAALICAEAPPVIVVRPMMSPTIGMRRTDI